MVDLSGMTDLSGVSGYNPSYTNAQTQMASQKANQAYQQAMIKFQNDQLAFQEAQNAYTDAMSMGSAYGYMPGGNIYSWPTGGQPSFTTPAAGTPTLAATQAQQQLFNQLQQNAIAQAGVTGYYAAPTRSQYTPGTVLAANDGSGLYGVVNADGSVQMVDSSGLAQTAAQRGMTLQQMTANATPVASSTLQTLSQGPPTAAPVQTQQAQLQAANIAAQQAGVTGLYYDPTQQGGGGGGTPQSSLQMQQMYGTYGVPQAGQSTLAAQQQGWNQAYQTAQFGLSVQQQQQQAAQQYLTLLSQLQGPADYGQYLKVLGSTPAGLQGLVGAAAGQYIPGGGTTGQAPQAQTLQNLVGAATGYAGGGAGANAATTTVNAQGQQGGTASPGGQNYQDFLATAQGLPPPSQIAPQSFNMMNPTQKGMLQSMYSNIGYSPQDISSMYSASLPKYAAGSAAGNMRLV